MNHCSGTLVPVLLYDRIVVIISQKQSSRQLSCVHAKVWSNPQPRTHMIGLTSSDVRTRARIRDPHRTAVVPFSTAILTKDELLALSPYYCYSDEL